MEGEGREQPVLRGAGERRLVVGLGNPGPEYDDTRHNCGFWVVDRLERAAEVVSRREVCSARWTRSTHCDLAKPTTFMNRSGYAVRCLAETYGYSVRNILVVLDDIELPLGTLRMRPGGGPGGHRGLESVIAAMQTDTIARLRIGIAPSGERQIADLADFVLTPFEGGEQEVANRSVARAAEACSAWVDEGIERAMNRFNGPTEAVRSES